MEGKFISSGSFELLVLLIFATVLSVYSKEKTNLKIIKLFLFLFYLRFILYKPLYYIAYSTRCLIMLNSVATKGL